MGEAIEQGRGHLGVAEDRRPLAEGEVCGDDGGGPLAEQTKYISYGPARLSSLALVAEETKLHLPTAPENLARALQTDAAWWATHHVALTERFEKWLASGGRGLAGSAR